MRVLKFGGSSIASAERIRRVAAIVHRAVGEERVLVALSAVAGVTDRLAEAADRAAAGDPSAPDLADDLRREHEALVLELATGRRLGRALSSIGSCCHELRRTLRGVRSRRRLTPVPRARIVGAGELLSAAVVSALLQQQGIAAVPTDALRLVRTRGPSEASGPDLEATRQRSVPWWSRLPACVVPVVTGFRAGDPRGRPTTLGRGGSDVSAGVLGAVLGASRVEIWTDVPGILSADPRLHPGALRLPRLSHRTAVELGWAGAKVLHPRTVEPLRRAGIPLFVRSVRDPDDPGTELVDAESLEAEAGVAPRTSAGAAFDAVPSNRAVAVRGPVTLLELGDEISEEALRAWTERRGTETLAVLRPRPGRVLVVVEGADAASRRSRDRPLPEGGGARLGARFEVHVDLTLVSVVGGGGALEHLLALGIALRSSEVEPLGIYSAGRDRTTAIVPARDAEEVARRLHDELVPPPALGVQGERVPGGMGPRGCLA